MHLSDVTGQSQENKGRLAIDTLGASGGNRLTPEVHHILHVLFVALEPLHQIVVVAVVGIAERPVPFEDEHGEVRRIGLLKLLTHCQHGALRRRVVRDHRAGDFFGDIFDLRHEGRCPDSDQAPEHDDRDRKSADSSRDEWPFGPVRAHADFTRHVTSDSWWSSECSSSTTPFTRILQPIVPPWF